MNSSDEWKNSKAQRQAIMADLKKTHREELSALCASERATGKPSAIGWHHLDALYVPLLQNGLVRLLPSPKGFSQSCFFGARPTAKGRRTASTSHKERK